MTNDQFIVACKAKGVNIKRIVLSKKSVVLSYNYDLLGVTVSETYRAVYTYTANRLQSIYDNHFAKADQYVRF